LLGLSAHGMATLFESEFEVQMERELRPGRCVGIFLLRCLILFAEFCVLTALLYWANRAVGIAAWLRICTAIALLVWGGFAWSALKALINAWVRTRFIRFVAKCSVMLALLLAVDVGLGITYPAVLTAPPASERP
jgi:hypothetical protein